MEIPSYTSKILIILNLLLIINFVNASPNDELDLGDACVLKDNTPGICKQLHDCDYTKQLFNQKNYKEILAYRCIFRKLKHFVCCPTPVPRIDVEPATEKVLETTTEDAVITTEKATTTTQQIFTEFEQIDNDDNEIEASVEVLEERQTSSTQAAVVEKITEETTTPAVKVSKLTRYQKALCENETPEAYPALNIDNERANIGEFPSQATIEYKKVSEGESAPIEYLCSGSLIANDVVITAAHCFDGKEYTPVTVKLGRTALNDDDEDDYSDGDDIEIEKVIVHPEYSGASKLNDIALIKLKRAVIETKFPVIKPICLSTNDEDLPENFTISGYGRHDISKTSNWLLKATVNEISKERCNELMQGTTEVVETQTCALGINGAQSCQGDSGSPMSYVKDNGGGKMTYLHAIVSYGAACDSDLPGIYTKVNKYLGWIEQELNLME